MLQILERIRLRLGRRVVETGLRLRTAFEDIGDVFNSTVTASRLCSTDALTAVADRIVRSVFILLAAFGDSSYAIIVQLDDLGDFVHIDGKTTLTSPTANIAGTRVR